MAAAQVTISAASRVPDVFCQHLPLRHHVLPFRAASAQLPAISEHLDVATPLCHAAHLSGAALGVGGQGAVETLVAGDLVLTSEGEAKPIRRMGLQSVSRVFGDPLKTLPIRIAA